MRDQTRYLLWGILIILVVASIMNHASPAKSAGGKDIIVYLTPEDYALLQKQLGFQQGYVSETVCDQDFCNFTVIMVGKESKEEQEFALPSHYTEAYVDENNTVQYRDTTYTDEKMDVVKADVVKDYLMSQIIQPEKDKEKEKDEYLHQEGGNVFIQEKK